MKSTLHGLAACPYELGVPYSRLVTGFFQEALKQDDRPIHCNQIPESWWQRWQVAQQRLSLLHNDEGQGMVVPEKKPPGSPIVSQNGKGGFNVKVTTEYGDKYTDLWICSATKQSHPANAAGEEAESARAIETQAPLYSATRAWDPGALVHSLLKSTISSPSTRRSPWPQTGPTWQCHISSTTSSCRRLAAILAPSSSCPDCTRQTRRRTTFEVPLTRLQWLVLPAPTIWVTGTCAEPETPISRL
jgi:hypothetical protein